MEAAKEKATAERQAVEMETERNLAAFAAARAEREAKERERQAEAEEAERRRRAEEEAKMRSAVNTNLTSELILGFYAKFRASWPLKFNINAIVEHVSELVRVEIERHAQLSSEALMPLMSYISGRIHSELSNVVEKDTLAWAKEDILKRWVDPEDVIRTHGKWGSPHWQFNDGAYSRWSVDGVLYQDAARHLRMWDPPYRLSTPQIAKVLEEVRTEPAIVNARRSIEAEKQRRERAAEAEKQETLRVRAARAAAEAQRRAAAADAEAEAERVRAAAEKEAQEKYIECKRWPLSHKMATCPFRHSDGRGGDIRGSFAPSLRQRSSWRGPNDLRHTLNELRGKSKDLRDGSDDIDDDGRSRNRSPSPLQTRVDSSGPWVRF